MAAADGALLDLALPLFETVDVKSVLPAAVEAFTPACRARPSNSRADSVAFERRRQKPIGHAPMHLLGLVALGYMWDAYG